ncbi:hypothetical protein CRYUN_Cryun03dG0030000 [Craigia yunnanensis]
MERIHIRVEGESFLLDCQAPCTEYFKLSFLGYLSSDAPSLASHHADMQVAYSDIQKVYLEPNFGGVSAGATVRAYPSSIGDPSLVAQRWDAPVGVSSSVGVHLEPSFGGICPSAGVHPEPSLGDVSAGASIKGVYPSTLEDPNLVGPRQDGPFSPLLSIKDLFCPFTGYKEIKVIHQELRHSGDRAMVLCFVEFDYSKCAMIAMRALQGYRFDDRKPDSPALRIHFAHFPFHLQVDRDDQWFEF